MSMHRRRKRRTEARSWAWHEAEMAKGPQGPTADFLARKGYSVTWDGRHQQSMCVMAVMEIVNPAQRALIHEHGLVRARRMPEWTARRAKAIALTAEALGL